MKRFSTHLSVATCLLCVFLVMQNRPLTAQTNFVKHAGNPILPLGAPGDWDDTEAAHAHVTFDGSMYRMWYSGSPNQNTYRIGYATSSDGITWNKSGMALGTGAPGSFDGVDAWLPCVLFDGSQYEMWYTGNVSTGGIGYITSNDPTAWTRQRTTPVLTGGGSGAWDNRTFGPVVLYKDAMYHMWYGGEQNLIWQTGYATSVDGITWTKHPNNPVLTVGASNEWDAVAALPGSVIFADGLYHMWYHGTSGDSFSGGKIGYATSADGVTWTKHPGNPIMTGDPGSWDAVNTWFPMVIKDGNRYRMWYTGRGAGGIDRLGYAEDAVTVIQFTSHVITTSAGGATGVSAADMDGDGDMDVLSADYSAGKITWYENTGNQNFTAHTVATGQAGAVIARAVDIDDDGDLDVISAAFIGDQISWHENDGNQNFTTRVVTSGYNGARSVVAADLDDDGDMDVLGAAGTANNIAWFENDGNENFTIHIITTSVNNPRSVRAVDLDHDGDMDVVSGDFVGSRIQWHENDGNENFTNHVVVNGVAGVITVQVFDVDQDGDLDVLSASGNDNKIAWHENDGNQNFTGHTITTNANLASWVEAADLDGDGDIDVLSASRDDDKVAWYENDGNQNFTTHVITTDADLALTVAAADVDGDGDMDILSASGNDNKIAWYENMPITTGIETDAVSVPAEYALLQNYPNPFNPATEIRYEIPEAGRVTPRVYNLLGQEIATLVNEHKQPGVYIARFSGRDLGSGVYFYRLRGEDFVDTKRMVLIK